MIVYLHNPSHEACERFVRETLLSQPMKLFLERNDIFQWRFEKTRIPSLVCCVCAIREWFW
ncbi:unnamed protein product [Gongylonema pulchrum]|uniref:UAS domain-containing protein n=1 Tax=Gongylonema pulchrum TaxID=637853 RepID=A0A183DEE8_9BILA|nr:unnamed protein product [Gongylonema pulchrum]